MSQLTQFDHYLNDEGPAALVIREPLMPVEGADGVLFPATFAAGDNFPGGYNIDGDPNGENVCLDRQRGIASQSHRADVRRREVRRLDSADHRQGGEKRK